MKKIYLIVQKKDVVSSLGSLRDLGVIHIEHMQELNNDELSAHYKELGILKKAVDALLTVKIETNQEDAPDWKQKMFEISDSLEQIAVLKDSREKRQLLVSQYEPWGNFDPKDFDELTQKGIYVYLAEFSEKEKSKIPQGVIIEKIGTAKNILRCILISREKLNIGLTFVPLPSVGLGQMKLLQEEEKLKIEEIETKIKENVKYLKFLEQTLAKKTDEYNLEEAAVGMKVEGELSLLKGFCPIDLCEKLSEKAKQEQWGLLVQDPSDDDRVPTLVRNPQWIGIIKPLFALINVLPGYKEVDISPVFLVFFSIFFGILIGDAGYGLVFFGLTYFLQQKLKGKIKDQSLFFLFYILSMAAIAWGVLTGTFLGTLLLGSHIKPIFPWLADGKNVQLVCFLIGAIHLSIARGWQIMMKLSTPFAALAELGWMVVVWGGFFLANAMVIGTPLMGIDIMKCLAIIGAGVGLVLVDIIVRSKGNVGEIGVGCILLFFSVLSACTDVVSYIRLYAVGLAGLAVADAFNEMALNIGFGNVVSGIFTTLILLAGHLFNIVLCCFGILVHGLRLNVLEFSGHLGLEWKGFKYQPFKETEIIPS